MLIMDFLNHGNQNLDTVKTNWSIENVIEIRTPYLHKFYCI